jgi:type IV secretory pathway VirJ component
MFHKSDSKPVHDDPEQSKRFIDIAREVEAEESTDAVDRAFKKILRPKPMPQHQDSTDALPVINFPESPIPNFLKAVD